MSDLINRAELLTLFGDDDDLKASVGVIKQCILDTPSVEAIPIEWIEKQKSECYPHSLIWSTLDALLKTWREEGAKE